MTDKPTQPMAEIPEADAKHKHRGISAIWIIPLVAAVIGGWLVLQDALKEKVMVNVAFKSADGLEAGKTEVKLRNIVVGKVKQVIFAKDLSSIKVTIEFDNLEKNHITDKMRFWVVKPRIGLAGVSGLDTLLSGAYIEVDPGDGGKPTRDFVGLEEPGIYQLGNPGTSYTLKTDKLGSLGRGSPVKFRDVEVGFVTRYKLAEDDSNVEVEIFIHAPHDKLVEDNTRFWNISGLKVDVGATGLQVHMNSVATLIAGGIAFSTDSDSADTQAREHTAFTLYDTEKPDIEEELTFKVPMKLYFERGVAGLDKGAPVEFKGLRVGTVADIAAESSKDHTAIRTFAIINIEPDRLPGYAGIKAGYDGDTKLSNSERINRVHKFFEATVKQGLRGQLKNGNLVTGKSLITLDIFPDAKKETIKYVDGVPVLPTVPESLVGLLDRINNIMRQLESLPVEEIATNLKQATASINGLAQSLNASDGGMMGDQAREVMDELTKASRSIRGLTEYLERHPESLLKGRSE
jgi:paraquat-inducible protein B